MTSFKWKSPLLSSAWPFPYRTISLKQTDLEFFNRVREIDLLSTILKQEPALNILIGLVNSEKSTILRILVQTLEREYVPVLNIYLRTISFNSVDTLVSTIQKTTGSWPSKFNETA